MVRALHAFMCVLRAWIIHRDRVESLGPRCDDEVLPIAASRPPEYYNLVYGIQPPFCFDLQFATYTCSQIQSHKPD
jgi:hypothetical protein